MFTIIKMSSLGFVQTKHNLRNNSTRKKEEELVINQIKKATVYRNTRTDFNFKSRKSVLTILSILSFASILSALSTFSIFSIASTFSILSIGSSLSILSVGSVSSVLSVGSNGCYLRFFANCDAPYPTAQLHFNIVLSNTSWDYMSTCKKDDYQKFKKYENSDPHPCDYQRAVCSFNNTKEPDKNQQSIGCKVRRKGSSTWTSMTDKPSFKVKLDDSLDMGTIEGVNINVDRFKLNNMRYSDSWSGYREVEAYDLFRQLGFRNMPRAAYTEVSLYKDKDKVNMHSYAFIQEVNDKTYLKNLWKDQYPTSESDENYMLFEADNRGFELKKAKNNFETQLDSELLKTIINREGDLLDYMNSTDMSMYYLGEVLTNNWDGACLNYQPLNYYISVNRDYLNNSMVRYIPGGMDRVFQGCVYDFTQLFLGGPSPPYCGPMQRILNDTNLRTEYETMHKNANVTYNNSTCSEEVGIFMFIFVISCIVSCTFLFVACSCLSIVDMYVKQRRTTLTC